MGPRGVFRVYRSICMWVISTTMNNICDMGSDAEEREEDGEVKGWGGDRDSVTQGGKWEGGWGFQALS
jgi:hypothetical protein